MDEERHHLSAIVQHNCHIADASHARRYTMCVYLLKMREYYRWEQGRPFHQPLPRDELGAWLEKREQLWEEVENTPFRALPLDGRDHDPFDAEAINRRLQPQSLVYSGGYGGHGAPHFFLGELLRSEERQGFTVLLSGREHARDLAAPPALSLGGTIFVRRESVRRMLWERIEEWEWKRPEGPMARALACHGYAVDAPAALERMADRELEAAVLHELGECLAGAKLGPVWQEMLLAVAGSPAEFIARAVRDHLADGLSTLPALLEQGDPASLHFYFANFRGVRRELYPELEKAYRQWFVNGSPAALAQAVQAGTERWRETAHRLLALYRERGSDCRHAIEQLLRHGRTMRHYPRAAGAIPLG